MILGRPVTAQEAETLWRQMLGACSRSGWHPVLTVGRPSDLVDSSHHTHPAFDARAFTAPREIVTEIESAALAKCLDGADEEEAAEWKADFDPDQLAGTLNLEPRPTSPRRNFHPHWLCLVEAQYGYSVPSILPVHPSPRNWAHGPGDRAMLASDHVAFLHTWNTRFGAELLYMAHNVLMVDVPQPPQEPLAVARAAIEQYAYCPDENDTTTYAELQTRNGTWQFCWD
ncbi:hypothetical protein SF23_01570 [Streptomyces sp. MBRL 10]|nr:hypothetical protein SF23_01570 [Streptomyces sp. MBRL 10]